MQGTSNVKHFFNNPKALDEFSRCMDPQFKNIKNWELFAFALGVPADVIRTCKLYSEYSPTIRLFKYLEITRPDMTVGDLRAALTRNPQRARHDLDRLLKDSNLANAFKISEAITNSTSELLDEIAFKLDSASSPTCTWIDFGLELGISRDKLQQFEMYNYNPTEALFMFLYATSQKSVEVKQIVVYLEDMKREDVLREVRSVVTQSIDESATDLSDTEDIFQLGCAKSAKDIFKPGSELLDTISRKLNEDCAGVEGWKGLARRLMDDHYIDDPDIISKLEPPRQQEIHSPTKKIIEWLTANKPDVTIDDLVAKCEEINRNDAVMILVGHYSRAIEDSYDDSDSPKSPLMAHCVQETTTTMEHILKDNARSFGLPKPSTKMIGREKEKENLIKEILYGENPLIVLHAATGYGKERLAVATSYELIEKHNYTCIYVDSDGILTVEDLAIKILTTCGIPAPSAREVEKVKELFKTVTRKCLIILDNFDNAFHTDDQRKINMELTISSSFPGKSAAVSVTSASPHITSNSSAFVFDGSSPNGLEASTSESRVMYETGSVPSESPSGRFYASTPSTFTIRNQKPFPWQNLTRKEEYQVFIEDLLKYTSTLKILATTWESFSVVDTTKIELDPMTPSESEELFLSRCETVHRIERSSISKELVEVVLEFCSNIPQLLCNAAVIVKSSTADSFATTPPEQQLLSLGTSEMSRKQRFHPNVSVCFDRLKAISQKVLMVISVLSGAFTLVEAATIFTTIISQHDLHDGLTDLMNFSFLSYDQNREAYYLSPAMRSFAIYKATQDTSTSAETDSIDSDLSLTYKGAISRFVYYTFDCTLKIENDFFSTCSANAIQRYRELQVHLKEIANWFISDRLSKDPDMKRLRYHIIDSFIQCYLVNIKLMKPSLLKTILCRFSRFCQVTECTWRCDNTKKKKGSRTDARNEYVECLTYGGVTCILGCLCIPQLCPDALDQAMWCFDKVLKEVCTSHSSAIPSLNQQLAKMSKCKVMSKGAQTQFLLKYGKCLVRHGRRDIGLKFLEEGIKIRKGVLKESKSCTTKDHVMVAVGYNDLASEILQTARLDHIDDLVGAYSYNNDSNGTAIQVREKEVLPTFEKYLGCHPFTASAFSHLAHDYLAMDLHEEAQKACEKALSYRRRLLGEHSETARSLFDMGRILREQACHCENPEDKVKKYEEALKYLSEALEMRQHLAFTPNETAQTHSEIADVLKSLGREKDAQKHVKIARVHVKKVVIPHTKKSQS